MYAKQQNMGEVIISVLSEFFIIFQYDINYFTNHKLFFRNFKVAFKQ
jgi:hypothetical protein